MPLSVGTRIGVYEIVARLGAGGMGEVYRARDPRLGREVAIKVLAETVANDIDRLARFQREAQLLASLNHPNIGSIYGLEESETIRALVLEAVEAAHNPGVIHRDLKPANVKVTPDGRVKVLDFGIAKMLHGDVNSSSPTTSPTINWPAMFKE